MIAARKRSALREKPMSMPDLLAKGHPWPRRAGVSIARRADAWLRAERTPFVASVVAFVLSGIYSLWLGADANWDLTNYHLYNPFAWLNGKASIDVAPAGLQTYFNPLIDLPFYEAGRQLPAAGVGFAMGALQGLMFPLLYRIARSVFPTAPIGEQKVWLLIAAAGTLTAGFLSELGNSMGDTNTALLVLAALAIILSAWDSLIDGDLRAALRMALAGVLAGLACGLKLTNAMYAVALCVSLFAYPGSRGCRFRLATFFGVGVLLGTAASGGYWMLSMWHAYGNPLYPQFSAHFPSALTRPIAVADTRWGSHGFLETMLWPFIFSLRPHRVSETEIHQVIWPLAYLLFLGVIGKLVWPGRALRPAQSIDRRWVFLLSVIAVGYVLWLLVFSIYRYLVAIEVLAPLAVVVMLHVLFDLKRARILSVVALSLSTLVVVAGGAHTWGHEGWSDPVYHADLPDLSTPQTSTVLLFSPINAWGWLATLFPRSVAFVGIGTSFPEGPRFAAHVQQLAQSRDGPVFALIDGVYDRRALSIAKTNDRLASLGITNSERGCHMLQWATAHFGLRVTVVGSDAGQCSVALPALNGRDIEAENLAIAARAAPVFENYGFGLDPARCQRFRAGIGTGVTVYQWCPLSQK